MMERERHSGFLAVALMLGAAGVGIACRDTNEMQVAQMTRVETATAGQSVPAGVRRVEDVSQVCMVNNQFMGKEQIPVEVEGKTYYGCCEMCKERLAKDPEARFAADPVSGARVDKATAVIGARPDGTTLYFESEANLEEYASRQQG